MLVPDIEWNGKKENKNSENIFITGDNLEVLRHLRQAYTSKIKCIYIDPPYNTGNDGFVYSDKFKFTDKDLQEKMGLSSEEAEKILKLKGKNSHSAWLTFIYPRLCLARDLLTDDGVIFISIDDNEQANLKLICDKIFGEGNFVYKLSVVNNLNGNDNSSGMMETQETCFIYAKNKEMFILGVLPIKGKNLDDWKIDELGFWKEGGSLKATGINAPREARQNLFFPVYINENTLEFTVDEKVGADWYHLIPLTEGKEMSWYWSKQKFIEDYHEVIVKKTKDGYSLYKKQRPALGDLPSKRGKTTFYSPKYATSNSNAEIRRLFNGKKVFTYAKSSSLIKDLLLLGNCSNSLILDFFAGSATTAHAVMALNKEDGGNRKYIMVQLDEPVKKDSEAYKQGYKTIDQISRQRIINAAKQLGDTSGFKHYKIAEVSNQKVLEKIDNFNPNKLLLGDTDKLKLEDFSGESLNTGINATGKDTLLTTWLLVDGFNLTSNIQELKIGDYIAYSPDNFMTLYCINDNWNDESTEILLNMIGKKEHLVRKICFYNHSFSFDSLNSLKVNIKNTFSERTIKIFERY